MLSTNLSQIDPQEFRAAFEAVKSSVSGETIARARDQVGRNGLIYIHAYTHARVHTQRDSNTHQLSHFRVRRPLKHFPFCRTPPHLRPEKY